MKNISKNDSDTALVPAGMQIAGAWSWRIVAISGAVAVFIFLVMQLKIIVIPFLVAILFAALLSPLSNFLVRHRWPKPLAVVASLVSLVVVVGGLLFAVVRQISGAFPELKERSIVAYEEFRSFLAGEPFNISAADINATWSGFIGSFNENSQFLASGVASFGLTAGHFIAGIFLALFAVIFMLLDGKNIWKWVVSIFPKRAHKAVDGAGKSSWKTLTSFVKTQVMVAGVDALGIGLGALLLQVPLAIPIAVVVFLGSFIPVVGAVVTGALAVCLALIFNGWGIALAMLAVVIAVQQLESHALQPFLIGKAVKVHPLAVVFSVAIGSLVAGIPGALFAVPIAAVLNTIVAYIAGRKWEDDKDIVVAGLSTGKKSRV